MMEYYRMIVDAWRLMRKWCVKYHGADQETKELFSDVYFLSERYNKHPFAEALLLAVMEEVERKYKLERDNQ